MLQEKWLPHIRDNFPEASRVAVGTKMDRTPEAEELPKVIKQSISQINKK